MKNKSSFRNYFLAAPKNATLLIRTLRSAMPNSFNPTTDLQPLFLLITDHFHTPLLSKSPENQT